MPFLPYSPDAPDRADIDALPGLTALQFGADWCGHCQAGEPLIARALATYPQIRRYKVEDGKGRPLGRSFGVKLWPTVIFLQDGVEASRLVRPQSEAEVTQALQRLTALPA